MAARASRYSADSASSRWWISITPQRRPGDPCAVPSSGGPPVSPPIAARCIPDMASPPIAGAPSPSIPDAPLSRMSSSLPVMCLAVPFVPPQGSSCCRTPRLGRGGARRHRAKALDRASPEDPEPVSGRRCRRPAVCPELREDVRDVDAGGLLADEQFPRDVPVAVPGRDEGEHLEFAGREVGGPRERDAVGPVPAHGLGAGQVGGGPAEEEPPLAGQQLRVGRLVEECVAEPVGLPV